MIELVVVIALLGILAAFAVPRMFTSSAFEERGYYEGLAAAYRLAQKAAVASGCPARLQLTASGYNVRQQAASGGRCDSSDTSWSEAVTLADGSALAGSAPPDVAAGPTGSVIFDPLGRPNLASDLTITVGSRQLTVRAESGLVSAP